MNLLEAQQAVWNHQTQPPQTTQEALARLQKNVQRVVDAFACDQLVQAQMSLEDGLAQVLVTMKSFGMDPERALLRSITRMRQTTEKRFFLIYPDRVEIRVSGEYRGGWPLYTEEDYIAAIQVARELHCEIIHTDAQQLDLFEQLLALESKKADRQEENQKEEAQHAPPLDTQDLVSSAP
ncbi:MAG: hypothetical protein K2X66_15025 [Cyanobacteria bacterium]|nr:hypothetical protein [Cyanobacteriota bacterium]